MQVISENKTKIVAVLGTGGTIAGTANAGRGGSDGDLSYTAAQLGIDSLLEGLPGISLSGFALQAEQLAQLDSKDMRPDVWHQLALRVAHCLARPEVSGIVITHGTDTLEETAYFLQRVLPLDGLRAKPVVLTCAMRSATSPEADGPQNLADAIHLAIEPGASGVLVVCAGHIHSALDVQKVHPFRLDAFDSGDAGPLGQVINTKVLMTKPWPVPAQPSAHAEVLDAVAARPYWPRVEIVMSHAGASGHMVDAMVAQAQQPPGAALRGIVVAGTGNGTVHRDLEAALVRAQQAGVRVWRATRCAYGAVQAVPGHDLPETTTLSPVKARIELALALRLAGEPAQARR
jgi:L-asparaginase